jgi:aerobic carbon-monoxide dehydrogenase medium subunit
LHELPDFDVYAPSTLKDAIAYLSGDGKGSTLLAGGTWLIPKMRRRGSRVEKVVDLSGLHGLHYVRKDGRTIRVGGLTTIRELVEDSAFDERYSCLKALGHLFGVEATRSMATVAGNLAAGEDGDLVEILQALGGRVVVQSARGKRVAEPARLGLAGDEMVVEVQLAKLEGRVSTWFGKFEKRRGGGKGIATATILLRLSGEDKVEDVRIVVNRAKGSKTGRAYRTESKLRGRVVDDVTLQRALDCLESDIRPTGDFRGSARFRREVARTMVKEGILKCIGSLAGGSRRSEAKY